MVAFPRSRLEQTYFVRAEESRYREGLKLRDAKAIDEDGEYTG
jgi:hypothetical protein